MKKIQLSTIINSSREMVWATIINDQKLRLWSSAFAPASHFVGGWQQGQSIKFLMKDGQVQFQDMVAEIASSEYLKFTSIHHIGLVNGDMVDFDSVEAKKWVPSFEIYELETISPQATRLSVDIETNENYLEDFTGAWSTALRKLKEVCENNLAPIIPITVTTDVQALVEHTWKCWTSAEYVKKWNYASDAWYCPSASNNLQVSGRFVYTMVALYGSVSFDFAGTYTEVVQGERIINQLDDGRMVWVTFEASGIDCTRVVEIFETEYENAFDLQCNGWQAILDNFKSEVVADQKNG